MNRDATANLSPGHQIFMLTWCLFALGTLAVQVLIRLEPDARRILDYADYAVCSLFFLDFVVCLFVGAILMCAGVGLFGTFSGFLAAWFLQPEGAGREGELAALRHEVAAPRQAIDRAFAERG